MCLRLTILKHPKKITVKKMDDLYGSVFERKAMPNWKILTKPTGAFLTCQFIVAPVFSRGGINVQTNVRVGSSMTCKTRWFEVEMFLHNLENDVPHCYSRPNESWHVTYFLHIHITSNCIFYPKKYISFHLYPQNTVNHMVGLWGRTHSPFPFQIIGP